MKTSPAMQTIITQLAEKHGLDLACPGANLRLEMPHYDPLMIGVLHKNLVGVTHLYQPRPGMCIADPGIVFFTGYSVWVPVEISQRVGGCRIYAVLSPDLTDIVSVLPGNQADLSAFAEMWASNIVGQGWLEDAISDNIPF